MYRWSRVPGRWHEGALYLHPTGLAGLACLERLEAAQAMMGTVRRSRSEDQWKLFRKRVTQLVRDLGVLLRREERCARAEPDPDSGTKMNRSKRLALSAIATRVITFRIRRQRPSVAGEERALKRGAGNRSRSAWPPLRATVSLDHLLPTPS